MSDTFIEAALEDLKQAEALLASNPQIGSSFHGALVLGDAEKIDGALRESPALALQKSGPRDWEPLLYVCFSRFASRASGRARNFAAAARVLLRHGANPNAHCIDPQWPDWPLSCLYGATGLNNNVELGRVLLEAGANPNDGESLYHSTEHADLECIRLLLEHGASAKNTNVLHHMLDRESIEGIRLLLKAGADPDQLNPANPSHESSLHFAVNHARSAAIIAELLNAGASIDLKRSDGRTAYALTWRSGQFETARLLESRGASLEMAEVDRLLGNAQAPRADGSEEARQALSQALTSENDRLLPDLASMHCSAAVRALLDAGVSVDARGERGETALHWACWKAFDDLIELLLSRGAALTFDEQAFPATPAGWLAHGCVNHPGCEDEYRKCAQLLLAAGGTFTSDDRQKLLDRKIL